VVPVKYPGDYWCAGLGYGVMVRTAGARGHASLAQLGIVFVAATGQARVMPPARSGARATGAQGWCKARPSGAGMPPLKGCLFV